MNIATMKPHRGTLILALGIISWFVFPLGIFAWVMGSGDLKKMEAKTMDPSGKGITMAGKILGMIVCVFMIFLLVALVAGFIYGLLFLRLS